MSLFPILYSNWWEGLDEPHSILNQHFGLGLLPDQLPSSSYYSPPSRYGHGRNFPSVLYQRPWGTVSRSGDGGSSVVNADKDQFKVNLDVQQFKPEEINVKVVDKCVIIEGKHEEKQDEHGWISRQFERRYLIPDQCNIEQVSSSLSSDGILTIAAPRKEQPKVEGERQIKIKHTGKPALQEAPKKEQNSGKAVEEPKKKSNAK